MKGSNGQENPRKHQVLTKVVEQSEERSVRKHEAFQKSERHSIEEMSILSKSLPLPFKSEEAHPVPHKRETIQV